MQHVHVLAVVDRSIVFLMPTSFQAKVRYIAGELHRTCVLPDSGERLRSTGVLSPRSNHRHSACSAAFEWCWEVHEHRFFTKTAIRAALKLLLTGYNVEVPVCDTPGLTEEDWLKNQTKHVQHLCKRAVRNSSAFCRSRSKCAMATPDEAETQVVEAGRCM